MRRCLALLMLAPLAACGDGPDMDLGGEDLGPDRFAIHSTDGGLRLALTNDFVYFALSDSVVAVARQEMQDSMPREGIRGAIAGMVRGGVNRALSFRARYPVAEIRDIRWEDGRMLVEFEDGRRSFGDNVEVDDRPVEEAFDSSAVEAFSAEFRRAKQRGG